jgi:hypothetical protein
MSLSERQLRAVYGVRGPSGACVYITTPEFWRPAATSGPAEVCLLALRLWADWWLTMIDLQGRADWFAVHFLDAAASEDRSEFSRASDP